MSFATRLRDRAQAIQALTMQARPTMASVIKAADYIPDRRTMVYKAADGVSRWLSRAATAFQDKDNEIVSKAALKGAAEQIMSGKQVPLRWWHVGSLGEPIALDIGKADLAFVCGETFYAGGTLKDPVIAKCIKSDDEQSIGFLPPEFALEPGFRVLDNNGIGIYDSIDIIEISVCPAGTARNYFTGVTIV